MPVPSDLFGAPLASTRIRRARRRTIAAHGAGANQTTVHLGPHSLYKRCALLLASGLPRPSARMGFRQAPRPGYRWLHGTRVCDAASAASSVRLRFRTGTKGPTTYPGELGTLREAPTRRSDGGSDG